LVGVYFSTELHGQAAGIHKGQMDAFQDMVTAAIEE